MALATKPRQRPSRSDSSASHSAVRHRASHGALEEINAYIAVRDRLLEEAEQGLTESALERLVLANRFLASCLKPARPPYHVQRPPEADALRELKRCRAIDVRIAGMRARPAAVA